MKTCTKCGVEKADDDFGYMPSRGRRRAQCKPCHNSANRKWRESQPEYMSGYRKGNEARIAELKSAWARANKGKCRESRSRWANRNAGYAEEYREQHREKHREYLRAYFRTNPGLFRSYGAARKAAKERAIPPWANLEQIRAVYELSRELTELSGVVFHVDHIVPLQGGSVCGLHCSDNLQVVRAEYNLKKNNRWWPNMWK